MTKKIFFSIFLIVFISATISFSEFEENMFITYQVNPKEQNVKLYWKDDKNKILNNFKQLEFFVNKKKQNLLFAMNAGMFKEDFSPLGLYIENQKIIQSLNSSSGHGNFYLKPNGIFYITKDKVAKICKTEDFKANSDVFFATQSGPMLVTNGKTHAAFQQNSTNLNIRNGVGILDNNEVVFVMSKEKINFYDFASYFKKLGCKNALYLDGFVSRVYYPEKKWIQTDGNFGVMIGVTEQ